MQSNILLLVFCSFNALLLLLALSHNMNKPTYLDSGHLALLPLSAAKEFEKRFYSTQEKAQTLLL